jgi:calcium/calmodulin-dependent protein kinase I
MFICRDDINKDYKIGSTLGSGSFAVVKHGIDRSNGTEVAVKVIDKSKLTKEDEDALLTEVEILGSVNHPHIVRLYRVYDSAKYFYMVMELCSGGELFDRIVEKSKYSECEAASVITSLASALDYCHSRGIVHRDLKPENLLLKAKSDETVKIADFGLAKVGNSKALMTTSCGTPGYVAAEVLAGRPYTSQVDLWSVGVILYVLLCGFPPFYSESGSNFELFEQIKAGAYEFPSPYWDHVSGEAKSLVKMLLTVDPAHRLTAKQLLVHPWVQGQASAAPLQDFSLDYLSSRLARKRLKSAIKGVMATNLFAKLGKSSKLRSSPIVATPTVAPVMSQQSIPSRVQVNSVLSQPQTVSTPIVATVLRNSVNVQTPVAGRLSGSYYGVPQSQAFIPGKR